MLAQTYQTLHNTIRVVKEKLEARGGKSPMLSLRLFFLELCLLAFSFLILLAKGPSESFNIFYAQQELSVCPYPYSRHKIIQARVKFFSGTTLLLVVLTSVMATLITSWTAPPQKLPVSHAMGEGAIDALGQYGDELTNPQPVYTKSGANNGPNRYGLGSVNGIHFDTVNHRLFVADQSNARVLVFNLNSDNTLPDRIPDNVLGQSNFYTHIAATTQSGMHSPFGVAFDSANNRLFVADNGNNRVLVFDIATITDGENAVNVLGQSSFTVSNATTTQSGMNLPRGLAYDSANNRLFVSDTSNYRVLVFDVATITDGENAINVLGKPDFITNPIGTPVNTQSRTAYVTDATYDSANNRLFVMDASDSRVLVFDVATITDGENAINILLQSSFTGSSYSTTQSTTRNPRGLAYDGVNNRLFVASSTDSRVLVFDVAEITNGEPAINVLGQTDFTSSTDYSPPTQSSMIDMEALGYDSANSRLFVGDRNNFRVLVFDVSTITNGEPAIDALGQYGDELTNPQPVYTKSGANNGPNKFGLSGPRGEIVFDTVNHRLFIPDSSNRRILIHNLSTSNTLIDRIPDNVLGQPDFSTANASTTPSGISSILGLAYDSANNRLFVADQGYHRVTVFDVAEITNGENAVNVLGQPDFTTANAAITQAGMNFPHGLAYDSANNRLFVADRTNARVLVFDVATITNGEPAINVLGQANFTSKVLTTGQSTMTGPDNIALNSVNNRLFVSESIPDRVLVFDVATITNGEPAINVLGQSGFIGGSNATTQSGMNSPLALAYDSAVNRLFVADHGNKRVLVFDVAAITNGEPAVNVLGQTNFTSATSATTQSGLNGARALGYDSTNSRVFVGDNNNRIMVFAAGVLTISGTVYAGQGVTPLGGETVAISVNGGAPVATATSNATTGAYTISTYPPVAQGDVLTIYLDGGSSQAVTVTIASGSGISGLDLYKDHLIVRCDNNCSLTNSNLDTADGNGDSDISALYTLSGTALTLQSGKELFIPSGHTFAPGDSVTAGSVTIRGTHTASANTTISGNFLVSGGTFTHGSGMVTLNGGTGTTQTLNSGGSQFGNIVHSGAGILQLTGTGITIAGTFTNADGSYDANGLATTVAGLATVSGGTYSAGAGTQIFNGGLTISGGTFTGSAGTIDINGALAISSGAFTAPSSSGTFTVSGDFNHTGGTFTHNSGTVTLDGGNQTITGATTFNNLSKIAASAATLTFPAGATQTVVGTLTLQGASASDLLSLRSSSPGTAWSIDPQGARTLRYLDLKDAVNINAAIAIVSDPVNSGNISGFALPAPSSLSGAALSGDRISLIWSANGNPSGTEYYAENITTNASSGWIPQTNWVSDGLSCSSAYSFRVKAKSGGLESAFTDSVTTTTNGCGHIVMPPPPSPSPSPVSSPTTPTSSNNQQPDQTPPAAPETSKVTQDPAPAPLVQSYTVAKTYLERVAIEASLIQHGSLQEVVELNKEQRTATKEQEALQKVLNATERTSLDAKVKDDLITFVAYGTPTTQQVSDRTRAWVIGSFEQSFDKLPETQEDWEDVIKLARGRFPSQRSADAEAKAVPIFEKIYLRKPDRNKQGDNNAIMLITYGMRPKRNTDTENTALKIFKAIYGKEPQTDQEWNIVRSIGHSGAKR